MNQLSRVDHSILCAFSSSTPCDLLVFSLFSSSFVVTFERYFFLREARTWQFIFLQRYFFLAMICSPAQGVASWIEENLGTGAVTREKFMGGSSWSSCYVYETSENASYFVKLALGRSAEDMFSGEAYGLRAMHATNTLRIPKVLHYGDIPASESGALKSPGSFIVMEKLNMSGSVNQEELGRQLALMHLAEPEEPNAAAGRFGFPVDNTIGGTYQPNAWSDNWIEFYREMRLMHQLKLANDTHLMRMGEKLCDKLETFFDGIEIKPSILHGDLWSGNITAVDGKPCIFDPASYYGHHEAEFGMSWCAGFSGKFWEAYHSLVPRAPGWDDRHAVYTLYHYLNHLNLFGGSYYSQCEGILQRLTRKL